MGSSSEKFSKMLIFLKNSVDGKGLNMHFGWHGEEWEILNHQRKRSRNALPSLMLVPNNLGGDRFWSMQQAWFVFREKNK